MEEELDGDQNTSNIDPYLRNVIDKLKHWKSPGLVDKLYMDMGI
jgi:hypothetical protein